MAITALKLLPGVVTDDTETTSEGKFVDSSGIRFVRGFMETLPGWESAILQDLSGICRGIHVWTLSNGEKCVAAGTNTHLYVFYGGALYDITPVEASGTLANPFSTTNGSTSVSVSHASHGRAVGDRVSYSGASAVGGLTISGEYTVTTVTSANAYTITASSTATSTAGPGGGASVAYTYLLGVGLADGLGGLGYGTSTYGTGTYGSSNVTTFRPRTWCLDNRGFDLYANPSGRGIYRWQGNTSTRAVILSGAPTQVNAMFIDPKGHVHALGTTEQGSGTFNPLLDRHSDLLDPTDWTASAADQAGEQPSYVGSRFVRGVATRGQNVLFTDVGLIVATYTGDPILTYAYSPAGKTAGLIGPNAVAELAGMLYWISRDGQFYRFDGAGVQPLDCTVRDDFWNNRAPVQDDKIYAGTIAGRNEVIWFYADSRDGNECSRYVKFNATLGVWDKGELPRTAWTDAGIYDYPLAVSTSGRLYFHEKGDTADGGVLSGRAYTGRIDLGDGETLMEVQEFRPDFKDMSGTITLYVDGYDYPGSPEPSSTVGPLTITPTTTRLTFFLNARQVALRMEWSASPMKFRMGTPRVDLIDTGDRF